MSYKIRIYGDPVLRKKNKNIDNIDDNIKTILNDMLDTMREVSGIGLAAPQVGVNLNMFVIESIDDYSVRIVINPEIKEYSKKLVENTEGCLSVPDIHKNVKRAEIIKVKYLNEKGETVEETLDGLLSRAFQHEKDHLDGILFVDKVSPLTKKLIKNRLLKMNKKTLKELN